MFDVVLVWIRNAFWVVLTPKGGAKSLNVDSVQHLIWSLNLRDQFGSRSSTWHSSEAEGGTGLHPQMWWLTGVMTDRCADHWLAGSSNKLQPQVCCQFWFSDSLIHWRIKRSQFGKRLKKNRNNLGRGGGGGRSNEKQMSSKWQLMDWQTDWLINGWWVFLGYRLNQVGTNQYR